VLFKTEANILFSHSAAVINDLDKCPSRILDNYFDLIRAGINRIVKQFLDNRGRPLDNVTRGNFVGILGGKLMNYGLGCISIIAQYIALVCILVLAYVVSNARFEEGKSYQNLLLHSMDVTG
jgi:hypothetical protein